MTIARLYALADIFRRALDRGIGDCRRNAWHLAGVSAQIARLS